MLAGIVTAFMIPWIPIILFAFEETFINRSFRFGLLTGIACNLSMGLARFASFEGAT